MILFKLVAAILDILYYLVVAHIILSWIRGFNETLENFAQALDQVVEPIYRPFRKIVPVVDLGGMGLDLTPLVVIILIIILRGMIPFSMF